MFFIQIHSFKLFSCLVVCQPDGGGGQEGDVVKMSDCRLCSCLVLCQLDGG